MQCSMSLGTASLVSIALSVVRELHLSDERHRGNTNGGSSHFPSSRSQWNQGKVGGSRRCSHFPATSWHWKPHTSISLEATAEIKSHEWFFCDCRFTTCTGAHEGHECFFSTDVPPFLFQVALKFSWDFATVYNAQTLPRTFSSL